MTQQTIQGRLISIAGSPGAGKTFLADKLAPHFNAELIYEHPTEGFPKDIKLSFDTQSHLFETILWFRNRQVCNYLEAETIVASGKNVITDVPLYHNQVFVSSYVRDPFLQDILYTMGEIDRRQFGYPDCSIYISTTPELAREFLKRRAGCRDWERDKWFEFLTRMPPFVDSYMSSIKFEIPGFIEVKRGDHDFAFEKDVIDLVSKIELLFGPAEEPSEIS